MKIDITGSAIEGQPMTGAAIDGTLVFSQQAMRVTAERTQRLTGAAGAAVELIDGDELVYRATSGHLEPYVGLRLRTQGSLSGLAVQGERPLRSDDTERDERVDVEAARRVAARSMIVVPLHHHRRVVGVLKVASPRPYA